MSGPNCIDCKELPEESRPVKPRPAAHGGPRSRRCATHYRAYLKARKAKAHETRIVKVYGLLPGEYDQLLTAQGGTCAICLRATGKARRLAVDHDHETGEVRGLLCKPCNRTILGHGGEVLQRAVAYLGDPPSRKVLRRIGMAAEIPGQVDMLDLLEGEAS